MFTPPNIVFGHCGVRKTALNTLITIGFALLWTIPSTQAATTYTWNVGTTGTFDWDTPANWVGSAIADGAGNTADFSTKDIHSGGLTVNLATSRTIGTFKVGDTGGSSGSYTFSPSSGAVLTLDNGASAAVLQQVGQGSATYLIPILLNSDLVVNPTTSGSIILSGGITSTGTKNITLTTGASGAITVSGVNNTGTILNNGTGTGGATVSGIGSNVTGITQSSTTSLLTLSGDNSAFAGTINLSAGSLTLNGATSLGTSTLNIAAGTTLTASATTLISSVVAQNWNGGFTVAGTNALNLGSGAIALGTDVLLTNTSSAALTFGGAVTGGGNLSIYAASTASITFAGAISHTGDLSTTRTSTGTTTFSGNVTNVGNITFAANGASGTTVYSGFVNNTGTISDSGTGTANFQLTGGIGSNVGAITHASAGTMTLGTGAIDNTGLISNTGGTLNITGSLGANVTGVTQNSAGATVLTGNNANFTGPFTIVSGSLGGSVTSNASANAFNKGHVISINTGGTFDVGNNTLTIAGLNDGTSGGGTVLNSTNNGSGKILTLGGSGTYSFSGSLVNATGTNPSPIGLTVALSGGGKQTLSGVNTYTSATAVNFGTLELKSGASALSQTLGALAFAGADGTLVSNKSGVGSISTTFGALTARSAGNTGNIVSTGGTNGTDNSINLTQAAGFINVGLYFNGADFAAMNALNTYVRALAYGTDTNTVAVNTITAARHVKLTASPATQGTLALLSLNLAGGGLNWTTTAATTLSVPGIIKSGGGSQSTISGGNLRGGANTELVIRTDTASDLLAISSTLTQGTGVLTKSGAGTLTLSGVNTYTGQTYVNGGVLSISSNVNLGAETTGATLNLRGGTLQATSTFGLYNGTAGTNNRAVVLTDTGGFDVTNGNTLTVAGVISGTGSLTKTNSGTLTLTGVNTYTGATNVNVGTLIVNGSLSNSSLVTVASGAKLGGSGTIGDLRVQAGGTHAPGNSPGLQTVTGNASYASGSTFAFELNKNIALTTLQSGPYDFDQVAAGSLSITNGALFTITLNGVGSTVNFGDSFWSTSQQWLVFGVSGAGTGDFTLGAISTDSLGQNYASYGSFDVQNLGGDIYLNWNATAIPEPNTFALLGIGLACLIFFRRRTRGV